MRTPLVIMIGRFIDFNRNYGVYVSSDGRFIDICDRGGEVDVIRSGRSVIRT